MKSDIHPNYNDIVIHFPGGDKFQTKSASSNKELYVDVDYRKHPAWTRKGIASANASNAQVSKFNKKFGDLAF